MEKNFINIKTSSPAGDLISYMAGIKQLYKETGKKSVIYQRLDMPGAGYPGSIHPYQNEQDEPICMPESIFNMLKPLICSQEYIEDFLVHKGESIDFDMDVIRLERYTGQPYSSLNRWFNYPFPQMASNLSEKYIEVPVQGSKQIGIINFTQRYRNHVISYNFLKQYESNLIFAGLQHERDLFCKQWGLDIPLLEVDDFLTLASTIAGCKFFVGNASFCFQLAEAVKVPRALEIFPRMPNVIPTGEKAYDYLYQTSAEYYFDKLFNS